MGKLTRPQKLKNARKNQKNTKPMVETAQQTPANDEDNTGNAIKTIYLPNNTYENIGFNKTEQDNNDDLVYDPSAYQLYHEFDLGFPCLGFSFLPTKNATPNSDQTTSMSVNFVTGSQISNSKNNQIIIGSVTDISYKNIEESLSSSSDEEEESDDETTQPKLKVVTFPHRGGVNKITMSSFFNKDYVASWSELGVVNVYDVTDDLTHLYTTNKSRKNIPDKKPLYSFTGHQDEGYALDWNSVATARLASGSCDSTIAIWNPNENTWQVDCLCSKNDFGHRSSVECIQWCRNEKDILASSGCDGYIKVWDTRSSQTNAVLSINAHPGTDVNVFSWNKHEPLLVSGDDNGILKVWDLRQLQSNSGATSTDGQGGHKSICQFSHHTKAITSVEWHPTDTSTFISAGEDDQVVIWDLAVDTDNLDRGDIPESVLPQIMFIHMGQSEIKECHWHPLHKGLIMSTAFKGFNIFKTISV